MAVPGYDSHINSTRSNVIFFNGKLNNCEENELTSKPQYCKAEEECPISSVLDVLDDVCRRREDSHRPLHA